MARCLVFMVFLIYCLISTVGLPVEPAELLQLGGEVGGGQLSVDPSDVLEASRDFGGLTRGEPLAVFHPRGAGDVAGLVRAAYGSARVFRVSARGHGHSISGQAQAPDGVVVDMSHGWRADLGRARALPVYSPALGGHYVDVWGGELWIDVLNWTLAHGGLAPRSWTDYLYLSVGGTLSNAGISGQAFHRGPQISNVYELDVVTGKGEVVTCSETKNPDLFFGALGGLGQFGIITRARIALEPAPQRVRWIRALYSNFSEFTADQERLISLHGGRRFDYVEGFVVAAEGLINNWRSSFFSPQNPVKLSSLKHHSGVLYCLEVTKNYDDSTAGTVDQEVEALLGELSFIPGTVFTTDLPYVDFLDRVHKAELKLRDKGMWEVPHPWLNLFVPASRIADFDRGVFRGVLGSRTAGGPILIYPMNKHNSVVAPHHATLVVTGHQFRGLRRPVILNRRRFTPFPRRDEHGTVRIVVSYPTFGVGPEELGGDAGGGLVLPGGVPAVGAAGRGQPVAERRGAGAAEPADPRLLRRGRDRRQAVPAQPQGTARVGGPLRRGEVGAVRAAQSRVRPEGHAGHRPGNLPAGRLAGAVRVLSR